MKELIEASTDYSFDHKDEVGGRGHVLRKAFNAGAEFVQRWIPVEEDLPKRVQWVIVKKRNGLKLGMFYDINGNFMHGTCDQTSQITHWRPIEIK